MSQEAIVSRLKTLIARELDANISEAEITGDVPLFEEGLGLDSVLLVELISLVEKEFDIKFSDDELKPEYFSTPNVLAEMIVGKQT